MGKKAKEHRKKVEKRNRLIEQQRKQFEKMSKEFINKMKIQQDEIEKSNQIINLPNFDDSTVVFRPTEQTPFSTNLNGPKL